MTSESHPPARMNTNVTGRHEVKFARAAIYAEAAARVRRPWLPSD